MTAIGAAHDLIGLEEALVFALIVGITGYRCGLSMGSDTEGPGGQTSCARMAAICLVIIADAAFAILCELTLTCTAKPT